VRRAGKLGQLALRLNRFGARAGDPAAARECAGRLAYDLAAEAIIRQK
jgi:hypothetical protein